MGYTDSSGNRISPYSLGLAPIVSLNNVSAIGAGTVLDGLAIRSAAVLSVTAATGVTAGAVQLEGSLDGANWFSLGDAISTTAAGTTQKVVSSAYAQYFRASVTTAVVGGKVSASVGVSG